ncbi:Ca(2+)-dependent cysteine protease [Fusarium falciforme]|nr:Ca(2+)-dependent cysteine protease [Fusarium falciforme]
MSGYPGYNSGRYGPPQPQYQGNYYPQQPSYGGYPQGQPSPQPPYGYHQQPPPQQQYYQQPPPQQPQ